MTRYPAAFALPAFAVPAVAVPALAFGLPAPGASPSPAGSPSLVAASMVTASPSASPSPSASRTPDQQWHRAVTSLPPLVSPQLPPLELSVFTGPYQPVAGQDYPVQITVRNIDRSPGQDVRLSIRLSPGLEISSVPSGCEVTGGIPAPALECRWPWLGGGGAAVVPLTVRARYGGELAQVGVLLRYDWGLWAYASVNRLVECPPPPPCPSPSPSPPARPAPPPHIVPRPRPPHSVARPPRVVPSPAPRVVMAAVPKPPPPPPPRPPKRKPRRHPVPSSPTPVPHVAELPAAPASSSKPVLPLGVLITAVLTPCVAAAATRFGRR